MHQSVTCALAVYHDHATEASFGPAVFESLVDAPESQAFIDLTPERRKKRRTTLDSSQGSQSEPPLLHSPINEGIDVC